MIWKIAKKEFLLNLMTFKFAVGTIVCVVLTAVFMPVLASDYQQRLKNYNANVAANEAEFRKVRVYRSITPTIYRPPAKLSVFSEGVEKRLGSSTKIKLSSIPEISASTAQVNPYLSIFPTLDVSLVFKVIMSILALLVVYDVISGERERGTLKLMLSGTVARHHVLLGKLLAGLLTLVVPLTIAFIAAVLIFESFPLVDLAGSDWARIGLMYIASLIFISAIYNFGLLFSCLTKGSATSLMFVLLFWVIFIIVVPNGSGYLAGKLKPIEARGKIDGQIKSLLEKFGDKTNDFMKENPVGGSIWSNPREAFGNRYILGPDSNYMESSQKFNAFMNPLEIRFADEAWEVKRSYLNSLFRQKYLAKNLSRTSPISLYKNVMSVLAGTDLASFQDFVDRVKTYRNEMIEFIRNRTDNFSSPSYFTPHTKEDCIVFDRYWHAQNKADKAKAKEDRDNLINRRKKETLSFVLQEFPRFTYAAEGVGKTFQRASPDLALLVFVNVLFFALSFVTFLRYDAR